MPLLPQQREGAASRLIRKSEDLPCSEMIGGDGKSPSARRLGIFYLGALWPLIINQEAFINVNSFP